MTPVGSPEKTPIGRLLLYGGPILGVAYLLFFVQFYFLKFATDVLLLSPAIVGAIFAVAKLWDAVADPFVGSWSDRSRSRLGRRNPFLLAALPFLALGFAMLFSPPASIGGGALYGWVTAALFVFFTAFAVYTIPHAALGAELSRDTHERTKLFASRQIGFTIGMLLAFVAIQIAMDAEDPRARAASLGLATAIAGAAVLAITPLTVREPEVETGGGGKGVRAAVRDVLRMRPARLLFTVYFIESLGVGAVGTMGPYAAEYGLERPDIVGTLPAAYVLAAVASIPLWVRVARRFGSRDTWLAAMALSALGFAGLFLIGPGSVALAVGSLVVAGIGMGCGGVLSSAILAQVIDLDAARSGERKEGIYTAALAFVLKFGTSIATALAGLVLSVAGFVPNEPQGASSLLGIRILFAGLPCIGFLVGALLFRNFTLDDPDGAPVPVADPVRTPAGG